MCVEVPFALRALYPLALLMQSGSQQAPSTCSRQRRTNCPVPYPFPAAWDSGKVWLIIFAEHWDRVNPCSVESWQRRSERRHDQNERHDTRIGCRVQIGANIKEWLVELGIRTSPNQKPVRPCRQLERKRGKRERMPFESEERTRPRTRSGIQARPRSTEE